jgi:hypothetical protein
VVRITPDEVHVQAPSQDLSLAYDWVQGAAAAEESERDSERERQREKKRQRRLTRKRRVSQVRSLLRVEVDHLLQSLMQKHRVYRVVSSRPRSMPRPLTESGTRADYLIRGYPTCRSLSSSNVRDRPVVN